MRLILFGPPGAGKGTQAVRVAHRLSIPAISTGDMFRANIAGGTALGKKVQAILSSGQYVPDEVTNDIVFDRLGHDDARSGFLLDGYPRTPAQVSALDEYLDKTDQGLDAVLELTVVESEVVARLLKRAQIEGRVDDTEEVVRERLRIYATETEPLSAVYRDRGLLREVDGMGGVEDVFGRILDVLGQSRR